MNHTMFVLMALRTLKEVWQGLESYHWFRNICIRIVESMHNIVFYKHCARSRSKQYKEFIAFHWKISLDNTKFKIGAIAKSYKEPFRNDMTQI